MHKRSHHFQRRFRHSVNDAEKSIYKIWLAAATAAAIAHINVQTKTCNWKRNALKGRFESKCRKMKWERMGEQAKRTESTIEHGKKWKKLKSTFCLVRMWQQNNQQRHSLNGKFLRKKAAKNWFETMTLPLWRWYSRNVDASLAILSLVRSLFCVFV